MEKSDSLGTKNQDANEKNKKTHEEEKSYKIKEIFRNSSFQNKIINSIFPIIC